MRENFEQRYAAARRAVIARRYRHLNPRQQEAVLATEGPLLLLAGAGSGKTTVLIHRVANLMKYGRASDSDQAPDWATPEDLAFLEAYAAQPGEEGREETEKSQWLGSDWQAPFGLPGLCDAPLHNDWN